MGAATAAATTAIDDKSNPNPSDPQNQASSAILGLKVVGGKPLHADGGELAAFITKVKRGSIADTVGHLVPGDQVLEWNGQSLNGLTFEQVSDIIVKSKTEPQVELIVLRKIDRDKMGGGGGLGGVGAGLGGGGGGGGPGGGMGGAMDGDPGGTHHPFFASMKGVYDISGQAQELNRSTYNTYNDHSAVHASVMMMMRNNNNNNANNNNNISSNLNSDNNSNAVTVIGGRIQIRLGFDAAAAQLIVAVVAASELPPKQVSQRRMRKLWP